MRVKLIDIDMKYRESKRRGKIIPNLALMKISAWHKSQGDFVGFDIPGPDKVYISCIFSKNKQHAIAEAENYFCPVSLGGSGISLYSGLGMEMEYMKPDYDLYPSSYSQGFTTRGCIRKCPYCIVNKKEGEFHRVQHVSKFVDGRFKEVMLMDNNILCDVDWFFENTNWIEDHQLRIRDHGMDIRLMTPEIARHLKRLHFVDQQLRFAFDNMSDEPAVRSGIEMLRDAGINVKRNVSFYVMSGFNTTFSEDKYRCDLLRTLGVKAFVMKSHDKCPELNHLARWANRRQLYKSMTSDEYLQGKISNPE